MRLSASLTSKGQITIPKTIRDFLRVTTGDRVDFVIDRENECVQLFVQQDKSTCLACAGKGKLSETKINCMVCLATGQVPIDFQPLHWIPQWQEHNDVVVQVSMLQDKIFTNGLYVPYIKLSSSLYSDNEMQRMNDSLLIYMFKQFVVQEKNLLEHREFTYLQTLLKTSLSTDLNSIFRKKDERNESDV